MPEAVTVKVAVPPTVPDASTGWVAMLGAVALGGGVGSLGGGVGSLGGGVGLLGGGVGSLGGGVGLLGGVGSETGGFGVEVPTPEVEPPTPEVEPLPPPQAANAIVASKPTSPFASRMFIILLLASPSLGVRRIADLSGPRQTFSNRGEKCELC